MSEKGKIVDGYYEEGGERMTLLWRDYQRGLDYQHASGLYKKLPEYVRFYEGNQWPAPTENTKNLPRPVVNMVKMICRNKISAILSARVRLVYAATRREVDMEAFNRFSDYIVKEIGQEALDKQAVHDGIVKGTYVYHYYWDAEARGRTGVELGGLRCEVIDPLSIFFANPREPDEQKQKWIMIAMREDVESVRAKADKDADLDAIMPDEATDENHYDLAEQEGDDLCTVLIRYFRRDGEVYCEKATKSAIVNKAFPITPDVEGAMRDIERQTASAGERTVEDAGPYKENAEGMDAPNGASPDDASGEAVTLRPKGTKAHLYPIVVGSYEKREGSIFGLGEVEGMIPNQKAINFNLAMLLLNAQQMAWGKYIVHKDALQDQVITNEPGQTIIDYTGSGQGIKKLVESGASQQPFQLIDTIMQLTRSVTGSTEVMTGEMLGANMSGAAIAQLQSQAQQPIEELRDSFWLVKKKQGKVLAQFFKLFYRDAEYSYEEETAPVEATMPGAMPQQVAGPQIMHATFTGTDYDGVEFDVTCEAMSGTKFSTAGDINVLDVLFAKGAISLPTYIKAYPDDALSNKSRLLELIEAEKADRELQLQQQLQEAQRQLAQSAQLLEQQKATVDNAVATIQENNRLKAMLSNLFAEANAKMNAANKQIEVGNAKIAEVEDDAKEIAGVLSYLEQFKGLTPEVIGEAGRYVESLRQMPTMEGGAGHGMPNVQDHDAAIEARQSA